MRVLRWPLALVLLYVAGLYLYAVAVVLPTWALALGALAWGLLLRRRALRRSSIGGQRRETVVSDAG